MSDEVQKRRILAPTDFSEISTKAVQIADRIARERDADLTLLHVHPIVQTAFLDLTYTESPEKLSESIIFLEEKLTEMASTLLTPMDRIDPRVLIGAPIEQIVKESATHGLMVMSCQGHSGLSQLLMGSVAERVIRLASCSVLIVK